LYSAGQVFPAVHLRSREACLKKPSKEWERLQIWSSDLRQLFEVLCPFRVTSPSALHVTAIHGSTFQFLRYKVEMPALRDFTLCIWMKSSNFSYPHPLFSYSSKYVTSLGRFSILKHDASYRCAGAACSVTPEMHNIPGNSSHITNSVALVRERTIPTERPPLVGEDTANFCG
jgi:hypothetical protein